MEPNKDTAWLHKMADAEDNANVCVGPPAPLGEGVLAEIEAAYPADMGIAPVDLENDPMIEKDPAKQKAFCDALDKVQGEKPKVPQLSDDEKLRLLNRAKKMRARAERFGKLHFATKPGEIIAMSDRHYQVAPDGSFRFVRMLDKNVSNITPPNNV